MSAEYSIDVGAGRIAPARQHPSPNCDGRPAGVEVDLLVVHGISLPPGEFGGSAIEEFFTNRLDFDSHPYFDGLRALRVSAHLLIRRDGEVVQFVPFRRRAWHAGESSFRGRTECNDFSIGVELEGEDDTPYADRQYTVLGAVAAALCGAYPGLSPRRICAHSDIAPGRKTDPGPAFDWLRMYDALNRGSS